MAISVAGLKTRFLSKVNALIKPKYIDIPDDHALAGYTYDEYNNDYFRVLAEAIVEEIQANARVIGLDSHNDTHELSIT